MELFVSKLSTSLGAFKAKLLLSDEVERFLKAMISSSRLYSSIRDLL